MKIGLSEHPFKDKFGNELAVLIDLEMQWIYSNLKLYTDSINAIDTQISYK